MIMEEGKYFKKALANMTANAAYVNAIRHLYDLKLNPQQIQSKLTYPVSIEKIEKVISEYEAEKASPASDYEYVQYSDEYGRKRFIRRRKTPPL